MEELFTLIPEGLINFLGWFTLFVIIVFKERLLKLFKNGRKKESEHNPNFNTMDDKLDDIKVILIELKTIINERLK